MAKGMSTLLAVTAALLDRPTLGKQEESKDSAKLSTISKTCLKMAFFGGATKDVLPSYY